MRAGPFREARRRIDSENLAAFGNTNAPVGKSVTLGAFKPGVPAPVATG